MKNNPFNVISKLIISDGEYDWWSITSLQSRGYNIKRMPYSIRILLENALRNFDGFSVTEKHIETILGWKPEASTVEIPFKPARVLMQDFTGVPAVVDLASLRSELHRKGDNPEKINPLIPVDLVIDHSVQVDFYGTDDAFEKNINMEYKRNGERYRFLKWAQKAFSNFSVIPPGMGICHQVNLEYLAQVVTVREGSVFPDTLVGTDSHTPMVNGIGVLGWGVGGIEAEAAMLGQPLYFILPQVVGLKLSGSLPDGSTATDMVLAVTELLRGHNVVGKFVEVFGPGLDKLTVSDRATISNMSPEFGCTATYFPIDNQTIDYMRKTNRMENHIQMVKKYAEMNMLWREDNPEIEYSTIVELDLNSVEPSLAGPGRPQDRILLKNIKNRFKTLLQKNYHRKYVDIELRKPAEVQTNTEILKTAEVKSGDEIFNIHDGSIVIAAITSCTNTSNPSVMIGAGLVAEKAVTKGIMVQPWVKTSLAPGSKVVTDYLSKSGLLKYLEILNFNIVGYGCTTCIGNSGPLPESVGKCIVDTGIAAASVLSGNRNFEARVHPDVKMNFLMSPALVVVYALAGRIDIDFETEPVGTGNNGENVYLRDIWPSENEISEIMERVLSPVDFDKNYNHIFEGENQWRRLQAGDDMVYKWEENSTYIKEAPFFRNLSESAASGEDIEGAYVLLKLGDSVTTDHISPAGSFNKDSPAAKYLLEHGVSSEMFNSYGSRRGNDEIMLRGTFANVRIKNHLVSREGGYTLHIPSGEELNIFDASLKYRKEKIPLIIIAGKEYGSGSSRDWAAKGTGLLGVKAVLAESYERIHRSNLAGMGVLPLQYADGQNAQSLGLTGLESYTVRGISEGLTTPSKRIKVIAADEDKSLIEFEVLCRLDSEIEIEYYRNGGILNYVLRNLFK